MDFLLPHPAAACLCRRMCTIYKGLVGFGEGIFSQDRGLDLRYFRSLSSFVFFSLSLFLSLLCTSVLCFSTFSPPPSSSSFCYVSRPLRVVLDRLGIVGLLDWRTLNENVSGSFERSVLSLAARLYSASFYSAKLLSALLQIVSHENSFHSPTGGFVSRVIVPGKYSHDLLTLELCGDCFNLR